jgi:hypothetical protein
MEQNTKIKLQLFEEYTTRRWYNEIEIDTNDYPQLKGKTQQEIEDLIRMDGEILKNEQEEWLADLLRDDIDDEDTNYSDYRIDINQDK